MKAQRTLLLVITVMLGLHQAMLIPNLSLFAHDQLRLSPAELSIFLLVFHSSGLVSSLCVPALGDRMVNRTMLFSLSAALAIVGYAGYLLVSGFNGVLCVTALLVGPANCQNSLFFSYLRSIERDSASAVATRGIFSAAWVIGPMLGTSAVATSGFGLLFGALVALNAVVLLASFALRGATAGNSLEETSSNVGAAHIGLVFIVLVLLHGSNVIATTIMPILVTDELELPAGIVGATFSICAGLEVLMFYLVSRLLARYKKTTLVMAGCAFGLSYYLLLGLVRGWELLFAAQVLNAVFIAIAVGGGMAWFQELMPRRPGLATGIFMNTFRVGTLIVSPVIGAVASWSGRYQLAAFAAAGLSVIAATIVLFLSSAAAVRLPGRKVA